MMADFINTIDLLGDELVAARIIDKTITEYNDDKIPLIGTYAFRSCSKLTSVDLPNATTIGQSAFGYCSTLTSVNLPNATSVGNNAFSKCSALTSVYLPNVTSISNSTFQQCEALTSVSLPNVTSIDQSAFKECYYLTSVDLPNVTSIGHSGFYYCIALTNVDLPKVTSINQAAFKYCRNLKVLVLRSTVVCTLQNTSAFADTPFASGGTGGTVYVPSALISQYQNATNWSTLYAAGTCNFVAIEGSEYE
jgi:hypothetical protein